MRPPVATAPTQLALVIEFLFQLTTVASKAPIRVELSLTHAPLGPCVFYSRQHSTAEYRRDKANSG